MEHPDDSALIIRRLPYTAVGTSVHLMDEPKGPRRWLLPLTASVLFAVLVVAISIIVVLSRRDPYGEVAVGPSEHARTGYAAPPLDASLEAKAPTTLDELLAMPPDKAVGVELARANLLCATGLRGSENLDAATALAILDGWADRVRSETSIYLHQFAEKPEDYNNSEPYFRIMLLITVLQQDLGVHYNMSRVDDPDFTNAQDVLICGMIGSDNGGTCSSMPVLYAAIGRRLGYPVKLVKAKEHLFCRWDGAWQGKTERFNIEGAGRGMNSFPDSHYMAWPHKISQAEVERGVYLRSLSPAEDLAVCYASRGYVLEANGKIGEAATFYRFAAKLDPRDDMLRLLTAQAVRHSAPKRASQPSFVPPASGDPESLNAWNREHSVRIPSPDPQPGPSVPVQ